MSHSQPDYEGRLLYTPPKSNSTAKVAARAISKTLTGAVSGNKSSEPDDGARYRWFRLKANLLFYFRIPSDDDVISGPKPPAEPMGVLVLENFHIQREDFEVQPHTFSIIFAHEPSRRHLLTAPNKMEAYHWDMALRKASIVGLRETLINLQIKIRNKLEVDPLRLMEKSSSLLTPHTTSTSKILTSSDNQLNLLASQVEEKSPKARPRSKKKAASSSTVQKTHFRLHAQEDLERQLPDGAKKLTEEPKPTAEWHVPAAAQSGGSNVPVANLLDL